MTDKEADKILADGFAKMRIRSELQRILKEANDLCVRANFLTEALEALIDETDARIDPAEGIDGISG